MNDIKYIPTNYSKKGVIETPWIINPEKYKILGYQPWLRNTSNSKPVQETVSAKTVSSNKTSDQEIPFEQNPPVYIQTSQNKQSNEKKDTVKLGEDSHKGKIYTDKQEFVKDMTKVYSDVLTSKGISTEYAKMLVAQDALESAWGTSSLSKYFNFGGIKAANGSPFVEKETKEYSEEKGMYDIISKFRRFNNLNEYANYKVNLLNGKRYNAFSGDPSQFFQRVKDGGYATDPKYVPKLTNIYNNVISYSKDGGIIPSRVDILVSQFNKQFNKNGY